MIRNLSHQFVAAQEPVGEAVDAFLRHPNATWPWRLTLRSAPHLELDL
jgi:hypothetical protein